MKKNNFLRIACLCFVVVFIFLAMPFSASAISNIDNTGAYSDLQAMGTDLSLYKPTDELKAPKIIEFLEYSFDANNNQSDFGIYLYVYNPSQEKIVINTKSNTIQLVTKTGAGAVTSNKKYELQFISMSTKADGENLDKLYYKFKVKTDALFLTNLDKNRRIYNVVDLELQYEGEWNPRKANVSNTYICTGFQANHGYPDDAGVVSDKSTHYCVTQNLETIEIELHPATWKTISSDKGKHYQYEVSSVYFSIPDYYLEKYGNLADEDFKGLYAVDGEWYEYKINGIVSDNETLLNIVDDYVGKTLKDSSMTSKYTISILGAGYMDIYYSPKIPFGFYSVDASNTGEANVKYFNRGFGSASASNVLGICNAFYSDSSDGLLVSTEDLMASIFENPDDVKAFSYVDAGRTLGHNEYHITVEDNPLNDLIAAYATDTNSLRQWLKGNGWDTSEDAAEDYYDEMRPIVMVKPDVLSELSKDEDVSKEYFICEEDVANFEDFVDSQEDRTTYLMRFAVTDYYIDSVDVTDNDFKKYDGNHYYFEKTIFHNFDVLSFTFKNEEGEYTTVPVSSKPISIVGNITADPDDNGSIIDLPPVKEWPLWLKILVLALGVVVIVLVISWLYKMLNRARNSYYDTKLKRWKTKEEIALKKANLKEKRRRARERRRPKQ